MRGTLGFFFLSGDTQCISRESGGNSVERDIDFHLATCFTIYQRLSTFLLIASRFVFATTPVTAHMI